MQMTNYLSWLTFKVKPNEGVFVSSINGYIQNFIGN